MHSERLLPRGLPAGRGDHWAFSECRKVITGGVAAQRAKLAWTKSFSIQQGVATMKILNSWIRFGATAILLTVFGVLSTAQTNSPEWLSLCNQCVNPMVTSKSGIGTSNAMAEARVTRAAARVWCGSWQPNSDLAACIREQLASEDAKEIYRATGDCTTGRITAIDGNSYTFAGIWDSSDIGGGRAKWRDSSGHVVGRDNASGGLAISEQWEVLCPGPLKLKPNVPAARESARMQSPRPRASSREFRQASALKKTLPQSPSLCAGQPLCYESTNFAATIADFRTSTGNGFKVIDAVVHFQNKSGKPLILGYVYGSASATDERGNRYALNNYGTAGLRGMGLIRGQSLDAKFVLQSGGAGDAHFQLLWRPGRAIQGTTFTLDISVREANPLQGNQFSLGGEFPLHYEGLANGMKSTPAAMVPAAAPVAAAVRAGLACGAVAKSKPNS